jgi:glyoxylase-like metal-dependent hydrolase (beta-lactamase superfamily II)
MLDRDVADGVHRVEDAFVNWYLLEEDGCVTAIDAGLPASWESLHEALTGIDRIPSDLEAIVLTHGHFDHVGFAEPARHELRVPVWVHEEDAWLARHPLRYARERSPLLYLKRSSARRILGAMLRAGAPWVKRLHEVRTFAAGEELDVPGRPHVLHTPGHTLGHCALHLPEREALLSGDALVTLDPYTGARGPQLVARAATADSRQALGSLDVLAATEARIVLPGHGAPWREGVAEACRQARVARLS